MARRLGMIGLIARVSTLIGTTVTTAKIGLKSPFGHALPLGLNPLTQPESIKGKPSGDLVDKKRENLTKAARVR